MRARRLALGLGSCLLVGAAVWALWVHVDNWLPFSYVPYYLPCPEIFSCRLHHQQHEAAVQGGEAFPARGTGTVPAAQAAGAEACGAADTHALAGAHRVRGHLRPRAPAAHLPAAEPDHWGHGVCSGEAPPSSPSFGAVTAACCCPLSGLGVSASETGTAGPSSWPVHGLHAALPGVGRAVLHARLPGALLCLYRRPRGHPPGPTRRRPPPQRLPGAAALPLGGGVHAPDGDHQPAHRRQGAPGGGLPLLPRCGHGVPEPLGPRDSGRPGRGHPPRLLHGPPPAVPLRAQAGLHRLRGGGRGGLLLWRGGLWGARGQGVRVYQGLPHGHPGRQGQRRHGCLAGGEPPEPPLHLAQALQGAVPRVPLGRQEAAATQPEADPLFHPGQGHPLAEGLTQSRAAVPTEQLAPQGSQPPRGRASGESRLFCAPSSRTRPEMNAEKPLRTRKGCAHVPSTQRPARRREQGAGSSRCAHSQPQQQCLCRVRSRPPVRVGCERRPDPVLWLQEVSAL
ncbi:globoside alpha-1,3-N-acetylgalactosaminyltransferase 1 isoform X1 [Talpa occidentalis]|uniref:globoside alpha-1,3-N-acetylgalactosaminyltransferase 1 isoform X1 n=1 Tax=Talpa occidentalis TaxID=50954 RepID=UPI0023F85A55|nr:globoside alpha-1,3-N-acetylgalactosaminyltransferase 1 isoform X1 [Talpa occidentalis]